MKRFTCPVCLAELHFGNAACVVCGSAVAYDSRAQGFRALDPRSPAPCGNRTTAGCNWLAEYDGTLCAACAHNRTVPDTAPPGNADRWREIEEAKRFLFYSILKWSLPHPTRAEAAKGLAFDFLADPDPADSAARVMTGHAEGLITLAIAEGDDAERERRRAAMGEPYRTLIGHFRHEVGHYYWEVLVRDGGRLDAFRAAFGDERPDYGEALARHYANGPPQDWPMNYISAYAASHPWEDFAETWAHYIHIVDGLETARAFGIAADGSDIEGDPYRKGTLDDLLADWVPLTVAVNSLNRSLGQPDFYPFVLNASVEAKLRFIHDLIRGAAGRG